MSSSSGGGDLKQKKKPPRVPKRGPGVAELEKILKERENTDEPDQVGIGICSSDPLPENFPFPKNHKDFSFTLPPAVSGTFGTAAGNFNANVRSCGDRNFSSLLGDANLDGSGRILPEIYLDAPPLPRGATVFRHSGGGANPNCCNCNPQSGGRGGNGGSRGIDTGRSVMMSLENHNFCPPYLPSGQRTETGSVLQFPANFQDQRNQMLLPPPMLQKQLSQVQVQHSMMNFSPNPTFSSAGSNQHHQLEPPSNQRSYPSYPSFLQEENNIQMSEGTKRQRLFHNLPPAPPFHGQIPAFPPQIQRPEPSFSVGNRGAFNIGTTTSSTSTSRDKITSSNFEHHMRKANDGITFGFPSALSSPFASQELAKGCCECSKKVHQIPETKVLSSSPTKSFYFFLQSGEEMGTTETREKGEDRIDLNLKL